MPGHAVGTCALNVVLGRPLPPLRHLYLSEHRLGRLQVFKPTARPRLWFQHLCWPSRPLPYLTWPITCGNSTGPDWPPPSCPFRSGAQRRIVSGPGSKLWVSKASPRASARAAAIGGCLDVCSSSGKHCTVVYHKLKAQSNKARVSRQRNIAVS